MTEPFLKWPGGKRWLASRHSNLLPDQFNRYIEPFLGSGAVFFRVSPKASILADSNAELINAYRSIRAEPFGLEAMLEWLQSQHSEKFYYQMRDWAPVTALDKAARFI